MSARGAAWLAWSVWVIIAVVCSLNLALFRGRVQSPPPTDLPSHVGEVLFLLLPLVFGTVGALVATHRPNNPIGWLLCSGPLSTACYAFAAGYAWSGLVGDPGQLVGAELAGWLTNWLWIPGVLAIALTLQLFPDGRVLGPHWRRVAWITVAGLVTIGVAAAVVPGSLNNIRTVANPLGWDALGGLAPVVWALAGLFVLVAFIMSAVVVGLRFRRSRGVERQQLNWLAYAANLVLVAAVNSFVPFFGSWSLLLIWVGFYAIPVAIGIAILRHRLYEIDLIIRRTLVYGALTAALGVVYWASVVVLQQVLQPFTQGSELAIVGSTLAVAALFQHLRQRIQLVVDRRFYRQRYDAVRTLEGFSARLRDEVDLDSLGAELLAVVGQTMQPQRISLWLRPPAAWKP